MNFPPQLALVNSMAGNALRLTLVEERISQHSVKLAATDAYSSGRLVVDHTTRSKVGEAYYLSNIRVKTLSGAIPKGSLKVLVDGETILFQPISDFMKEVDPAKVPWPASRDIFGAVACEEDRIKPEIKVGFILPNGTRVLMVADITTAVDDELEIAIVGAEYRAKGSTVDLKENVT